MKKAGNSLISKVTTGYVAPVLFNYCMYVVKNAIAKDIKKLYFLARDGYILRNICEKICAHYGVDIHCKYLYCSRYALRIPTYSFIGEEAVKLIFVGSYNQTVSNIFSRIEFPQRLKERILEQIGYDIQNENIQLTKEDVDALSGKLSANKLFCDYVSKVSQDAYVFIEKYFKQEGLLDGDVALVDTGWTGSMQRSIRQILQKMGFKNRLIGFYFGLFVSQSEEDGEYNAFYFDGKSKVKRYVQFNNNLLEVFCSAPHNMTRGYCEENERIIPIFSERTYDEDNLNKIKDLQENVYTYVDSALQETNLNRFNINRALKETEHLIVRLMYKPTKGMASAFSGFNFCDDIVENYSYSIVQVMNKSTIRQFSFIRRACNKLFKRKNKVTPSLFWPYGSLAVSDIKFKRFYRFNLYMWDYLRYKSNRK